MKLIEEQADTVAVGSDMSKISVIIPCYNGEEYVKRAIDSVKSQIYDKWDCVIVDDGSTDDSGKIIDRETKGDYRFQVIHTENRGVAAARNLAISKCAGQFILPLDADDKLTPFALDRISKVWKYYPNTALVVPQILRIGIGRRPIKQERRWTGYEELKERCTPANSSCFRKDDWERVGGYRDGTMYEDWEFWLRLLYHNDTVVNIAEPLVWCYVRPHSRWHQAVKFHEREVEIIKKMNPEIYGQ